VKEVRRQDTDPCAGRHRSEGAKGRTLSDRPGGKSPLRALFGVPLVEGLGYADLEDVTGFVGPEKLEMVSRVPPVVAERGDVLAYM
jgi:hypothetical protein